MKLRILFFLFFLPAFSYSQKSDFKKLSRPEKCWVVFHPFVAKKAYRMSVEARALSKEMENDSLLDHDADGGQVDAFRHAYWMARLSQVMCSRKAMSLGKAHEKGNYLDFKKRLQGEEIFSDSIAGAMDLFNNRKGIEAAIKNKSLSGEEIQKIIITGILNGEMKIILKDNQGRSLDCERRVLDMKKYAGHWNVPRCLVNSNAK